MTPQYIPSRSLEGSPIRNSLTAKKYTQDHEAVVFDDSTGVGTVSITDYAQSSLGDVVFVELPSVGTEIEQGGEYSPICLVQIQVSERV